MAKSNKNLYAELNSVKESLVLICRSKLNKNQKKVLKIISNLKDVDNATKLANKVAEEANFALSTSWNIIRSLREFKLLNLDSQNIILTESGKILNSEVSKNEF